MYLYKNNTCIFEITYFRLRQGKRKKFEDTAEICLVLKKKKEKVNIKKICNLVIYLKKKIKSFYRRFI
jgi:hypothetical protein